MPRRDDLETILIVGSGPIVIGQACEFDYSGTQACKVLQSEGYRVVLVNSNPATIMTDPEFAAATYVELDDAMEIAEQVGYPLIVRPSFILGGGGTGVAHSADEMRDIAERGLAASPVTEILIEQSVVGWKEFELEVMRDHADNVVVVCSIENFDPMGVHTGDSITVAPAQTLTDVEYQRMRDAAFACIRRIGVDTGGSNIQFAVNPADGRQQIIEMNPRVSRSSALASKATGFPIAKIAARLAVGYRLDQVVNDITGETPASFEPTIDYVVTKVPRWAFEKLPGATATLGTMMQSVGEAMAIGRTFPESLQKAIRSLETGRLGLNCDPGEEPLAETSADDLVRAAAVPTPDRPFALEGALRRGVPVDRLAAATGIDPWFLDGILQIVEERTRLAAVSLADATRRDWRPAKRLGVSGAQSAYPWPAASETVRAARLEAGVDVTYKTVDTCAAEFEAKTPYHYGTFEDEDEVAGLEKPAVVILGSGPNRIGQGVEFDYCCVHAAFALSDAGYETVMVNCNPETVSTDYDTSDRLFFEPLTGEDVLAICAALAGRGELAGVIVGLGGQTPLKLARTLADAGIPILGTSPASIDLAEDRERFNALCTQLGIPQPEGGTAASPPDARAIADGSGYPVLVRPSYVLGGRAMQIVYDGDGLDAAMAELARTGSLGREGGLSASRPALIDRFLEDAIEVDVDALRDRVGEVVIGGVMGHIAEAGVDSGDSAWAVPPPTLPPPAPTAIGAPTPPAA